MMPSARQAGAEALLPEAFSDLEPFVSYWASEGFEKRRFQRSDTTMEEIQRFYDAVYPRAEAAMVYLEPLGIRDLAGPDRRLAQLILALGQASMAVEVHREVRVPYSPWPVDLKILADDIV
jgi:hypothetical protein